MNTLLTKAALAQHQHQIPVTYRELLLVLITGTSSERRWVTFRHFHYEPGAFVVTLLMHHKPGDFGLLPLP